MRGSSTPLIIAGGGGGVDYSKSRYTGCDASAGRAGRTGHKSLAGGSGGQGAQTASSGDLGESRLKLKNALFQLRALLG